MGLVCTKILPNTNLISCATYKNGKQRHRCVCLANVTLQTLNHREKNIDLIAKSLSLIIKNTPFLAWETWEFSQRTDKVKSCVIYWHIHIMSWSNIIYVLVPCIWFYFPAHVPLCTPASSCCICFRFPVYSTPSFILPVPCFVCIVLSSASPFLVSVLQFTCSRLLVPLSPHYLLCVLSALPEFPVIIIGGFSGFLAPVPA